jgi:type II secretory pathway component GspD/PulD (secretin)
VNARTRLRLKPSSTPLGLTLVLVLTLLPSAWATAAEPLFVGILALVEDPDVAKEIALSDVQKQKLDELIEARESDALELAMKLKGLSPGEQAEKLAPFRRESEDKGFRILTPEQRERLAQIRVRRLGLASLADPAVAAKIELTPQQQGQVAELLREREDRLAKVGRDQAHVVRSDVERKLGSVLTPKQSAAWDALSTAAGGTAASTAGTSPAVTSGSGTPPSADTAAAPATGATGPAPFPDDTNGKPPPALETVKPAPTTEAAKGPGADEKQDAESKKIRFSFRYQPWKEVLDWFAEQAGFSLVMENPPKGTFNYTDDRDYTPGEAIDLLNSVLQTKGYTLIRRNRMLMLINVEDGIPSNLVPTVPVEKLDEHGESELVSTLFQLEKLAPEEFEPEVRKMIGLQGSVVALPKSKQLLVTETVGRLKAIRRAIQRGEDPEGRKMGEIRSMEVKYADPKEAMVIVRQFLDIPPEQPASADGSIRIIFDPTGTKFLVTGKEEKIARVAEVLKSIDIPEAKKKTDGLNEAPQLEVYSITASEPQAVLQVMQTLLAGSPDVRLAIDPKTGNLVALARPADHATIKATLDQMQRDARKVEVIQLTNVDPQTAVSSINKLFGGGEGAAADPNKPQVDADPTTKQLLVRASESQLQQIRTLLEKMGETGAPDAANAKDGNVRMLPLTGRSARAALERAEEIWPTMRKNRIRVVTPSAAIPSFRPSSPDETPASSFPGADALPSGILEQLFGPAPLKERPASREEPAPPGPSAKPAPQVPLPKPPVAVPEPPAPKPLPPALRQTTTPPAGRPIPGDKSTGWPVREMAAPARVFFAAQVSPAPEAKTAEEATETKELRAAKPLGQIEPQPSANGKVKPKTENEAKPNEVEKTKPETVAPSAGEPAPIIVAPGTGGIMIASEDIEALNAFEELLNTLSGNAFASDTEVTIFYLKNAKAETIAETLDQIFGTSSSGGGGGGARGGRGGLLGDIAGAALGDAGGGMLGSLLGLGGGGGGGAVAPSGSIQITPDPRLNALFVQASPADIELIEQLLKVLDQKESPEEVMVVAKPRVIPVRNTQAEDIADLVKQVYQNRLTGGTGAAAGQPPNPEQLIQMLRGGGGGRRSGSQRGSSSDNQEKMSLGVDTRNNALIVVAPDLLFQEVKQLVEQLDEAAGESKQSIQVVSLKQANPVAVQAALSALLGQDVQVGRTAASRARRSTQGSQPQQPAAGQPAVQPPGTGLPAQIQEQLRSRMMPGGGQQRSGRGSRSGRGTTGQPSTSQPGFMPPF